MGNAGFDEQNVLYVIVDEEKHVDDDMGNHVSRVDHTQQQKNSLALWLLALHMQWPANIDFRNGHKQGHKKKTWLFKKL